MSDISYSEARRTLHRVLQNHAFRQSAPPHPWWYSVLQWIGKHLHLSIQFGQLKPLAWVITITIAAVFIATVAVWLIYRWRRRSWKLVERSLASDKKSTIEQQIEASIEAMNWEMTLHLLITACIRYAQAQNWLRDRPYKTARRCLREVKDAADPSFAALFSELAVTAEEVVFARKRADADRILYLWAQVRLWREKVSA